MDVTKLFEQINFEGLLLENMGVRLIRIGIYLILGLVLLRLIQFLLNRTLKSSVSPQALMLIKKFLNYLGFFVILLLVLHELDVQLTAILGAAGVLGLALGVASRNSLGNIISGLFLIGERPFEIGNIIQIGDKTGVVDSIDLLSIKIITFSNHYIRIPNETIINSDVVNITRFRIRRMDITLTVERGTDLNKLEQVLRETAGEIDYCLTEPEPLFLLQEITETGTALLFGVWFQNPYFVTVKNELLKTLEARFAREALTLAVPKMIIRQSAP